MAYLHLGLVSEDVCKILNQIGWLRGLNGYNGFFQVGLMQSGFLKTSNRKRRTLSTKMRRFL